MSALHELEMVISAIVQVSLSFVPPAYHDVFFPWDDFRIVLILEAYSFRIAMASGRVMSGWVDALTLHARSNQR